MMKTFIHSHRSLENRTRFQTKMGEVYTCFQNKTGQNPYPLGRHKPIWVIQYPPGGVWDTFLCLANARLWETL